MNKRIMKKYYKKLNVVSKISLNIIYHRLWKKRFYYYLSKYFK